jgi:hypothetical protein
MCCCSMRGSDRVGARESKSHNDRLLEAKMYMTYFISQRCRLPDNCRALAFVTVKVTSIGTPILRNYGIEMRQSDSL